MSGIRWPTQKKLSGGFVELFVLLGLDISHLTGYLTSLLRFSILCFCGFCFVYICACVYCVVHVCVSVF